MIDGLTAEEVRALLKLEPHATCGFVRVSFISNKQIAPGGLPAPFVDGRPAGSALYFMVTPDAQGRYNPASLVIERTVTINTAATGGNAALLSLPEA